MWSCNSCRLRVIPIFSFLKSDRKRKWPYVAPPSGIDMTNRQAAIGFLLLFYALRSSDSSHLRVIIDFYCSKIRPEAEMGLTWPHVAERT
jgi:hypothetical protein